MCSMPVKQSVGFHSQGTMDGKTENRNKTVTQLVGSTWLRCGRGELCRGGGGRCRRGGGVGRRRDKLRRIPPCRESTMQWRSSPTICLENMA